MRAVLALLVFAGAIHARPPQAPRAPQAPPLAAEPAPVPVLTPEDRWRAEGWRRDAAGQWYRWLSTPVTPAWSGGQGRQYVAPPAVLRGAAGC